MWLDTWDVHKPLGRAAQVGKDPGTHSAGKGTARRAGGEGARSLSWYLSHHTQLSCTSPHGTD